MAERRDVEELDKLSELYKAVRDGDFHKTREILMSLLDNTVNWEIPDKGQTVLHTAVTYGHEDIVEVLVMKMSNEGLAKYDSHGYTALSKAAVLGKQQMVDCMLQKYSGLISIKHRIGDHLPVVMAIDFGQIEMARHLYHRTLQENNLIPQDNDQEIQDHNGATLFTRAIYIGTLGMRIPPVSLTGSETRLNISTGDQHQSNQEDHQNIISVLLRSCAAGVLNFFGITLLFEMKKIHDPYIELLSLMSEEISNSKPQKLKDGLVHSAICQATKNGIFEFVSKMLKTDLEFITVRDKDDRNLFMLAVLHRHEKIFSILYSQDMMMNYYSFMKCLLDVDGNNILHMAGIIEHSTPVNQIPGAALQMQRELQWFKEVGKIVHPKDKKTKTKMVSLPNNCLRGTMRT
ncbi:hypothetical protein I3760_12G022100 [Carya illinoinensis]|nr:hypothetical protein I3760_12G022100 [Carya illinoinensis]